MAFPVRVMNDVALEEFRAFLQSLRTSANHPFPKHLLEDASFSTEFISDAVLEPKQFANRFEMSAYLHKFLAEVDTRDIENNIGLWAWLSLFFFNQVCPRRTNGVRVPGRDYRHIMEPGYRYGHRHLLAGPYMIYREYGDAAMLMLCTKIFIENSFHHQIASRQSFISNPGIVAAAHSLYLDTETRKPKRGAQQGRQHAGSLIRFIDVVQQLDLNYDLYNMSTEQILKLLPSEFDKWKN